MAKYLGIPLTVSNGNKVPLTAQPELISNNDFSVSGTLTNTSWSLGWESSDTDGSNISGGIFSLINDDDSDFDGRAWATNGVDARLALEQNQAYELTYTIAENLNNASLNIYYGVFSGAQPNTVGTHTVKFIQNGSSSNMFILRNATNNTTIKFSSVFLKEIAATETPTYGSPELVTNGDFPSGITGWTDDNANLSYSNNSLKIEIASNGFGGAYQAITTEVGKIYNFETTFSNLQGNVNNLFLKASTTAGGNDLLSKQLASSAITTSATFVATTTTTYITVGLSFDATESVEVDNISVKEVPFVTGTREFVKNGDFRNGTTGWSPYINASLSVENNKLRIVPTIASTSRATQGFDTEIGKTYSITASFENPNSSTVLIGLSPNADGGSATFKQTTASSGTINVFYTATSSTTYASLSRNSNDTNPIYYSDVSVVEIGYNYLQVSDGGFKKSVKEGDVVFNTSTGTEGVVKEVIDNNVLLMSNNNFSTADEFFNVFAANGDTRGNQLIKTDNYIMSEYDENTSNPQESSFWFAGGKNSDKVVLTQLNPATNTFFVAGVIEEYLERLNSQSATDSRLDIPLDAFRDHQYNETLTTTAITLS